MKALAVILVLTVSGCASYQHITHWSHPEKDTDGYRKDRLECEVKAGQAGYRRYVDRNDFMVECLETMGWTSTLERRCEAALGCI